MVSKNLSTITKSILYLNVNDKSNFKSECVRRRPMYTNVCKHCHNVFQSKFKTYSCKECKEIDYSQFDDIEAYLKEFPNSNALQISETLGITAYEVLSFIKEGRLNMSKGVFSKLN